MLLEDLRNELFEIDLKIESLILKKQLLVEKIGDAKQGVAPLYSPKVEKEKTKKLLKYLKKEIEKEFVASCKLQSLKTKPNLKFGVDEKAKNLHWLKALAPVDEQKASFLFTNHHLKLEKKITIEVLKQYRGIPHNSYVACVVSNQKSFFRKKVLLYGKNLQELHQVSDFLEKLAASVEIRIVF